MSVELLVFLGYVLSIVGLIVVAIAYAVHISPPLVLSIPTSLDCRDGVHGGCQYCDGCKCHELVLL